MCPLRHVRSEHTAGCCVFTTCSRCRSDWLNTQCQPCESRPVPPEWLAMEDMATADTMQVSDARTTDAPERHPTPDRFEPPFFFQGPLEQCVVGDPRKLRRGHKLQTSRLRPVRRTMRCDTKSSSRVKQGSNCWVIRVKTLGHCLRNGCIALQLLWMCVSVRSKCFSIDV